MLATSTTTDLSLPLRLHLLKKDGFRRKSFSRHVPIEITTTQYTLKTVETYDEYLQVMSLRHQVFQKEFAGKRFCLRSDRDAFDADSDFLVVKDNQTGDIVGCYRLLCSKFTSRFYSATEFDISDLLQTPGTKLELSRACILKSHRNGRVLGLLWRGITTYMNKVGAQYFFGCGSVSTISPETVAEVEQIFEGMGVRSNRFHIPVLPKYQLSTPRVGAVSNFASSEGIPSLLKSYFKAGARVCSAAAVDYKFRCVDFLLVLDAKEFNAHHRERYGVA